jgi:hypothetical protein
MVNLTKNPSIFAIKKLRENIINEIMYKLELRGFSPEKGIYAENLALSLEKYLKVSTRPDLKE